MGARSIVVSVDRVNSRLVFHINDEQKRFDSKDIKEYLDSSNLYFCVQTEEPDQVVGKIITSFS